MEKNELRSLMQGAWCQALSHLQASTAEFEKELTEYVPRVLLKDGIDPWEARHVRGFLEFLSPSERPVLRDEEITSLPAVAIIGDAGSGKSFILRKVFLDSVRRSLASTGAPVPFLLDLGQDLVAQQDIATALDFRYHGLFQRAITEHEPGCILFLDSLDEKLLTEPREIEFINAIALFLQNHQGSLLCVVLACRRSFWNPQWLRSLGMSFEVFYADYLDFSDYGHILRNQELRQNFFNNVDSMGISDLLRSPLVGFDLARSYSQGESLPPSRRDWFEKQIVKLLKGRPKDREQDACFPIRGMRFLSTQLACLATWGPCSSWTPAEAIDQLGDSTALGQASRVPQEAVEVLFRRPLFRRTNGQFSFSHQLYREYLAAESLASLPIRKQKQLLTASVPSLQDRILMPHRGVAVALAEISSNFRGYLLDGDPLVAFLTELPTLSDEDEERLLRTVIDSAIAGGRLYSWPIPPRGDRPERVLHKHQPQNAMAFLQPYLGSYDELPRFWATACAREWGGVPELNDILAELALDPDQHIEIRMNSIQAVFASGHRGDIQKLYGLLSSGEDEIRGTVLRVYRQTEKPSPRDFVRLLRGGVHDDRLFGILRMEAWGLGSQLGTSQELAEALQAVDEFWEQLGDLRLLLVEGLIHRAVEFGMENLPPSLVIKVWHERDRSITERIRKEIESLLLSNSAFLKSVWFSVLELLGQDDPAIFGLRLSEEFAKVSSHELFALLPPDAGALNLRQRRFVEGTIARLFSCDPSIEQLNRFQELAPVYTEFLRIPKSVLKQSGRDQLEDASKVARTLNRDDLSAVQKTWKILSAIGEILQGHEQARSLDPDKVIEFLRTLQAPLGPRVLKSFFDCIEEVEYSRIQREKPNEFTLTNPVYAIPFWVLWKLEAGHLISIDKLDAFLRCYAFLDLPPGVGANSYYPLLDRLREHSAVQWQQCIFWLLEFPPVGIHRTLDYLEKRKSDLYLQQARQRLQQCQFNAFEFALLFDYWRALEPSDSETVLCQCYQCMKPTEGDAEFERQRNRLLWYSLCCDRDWAWEELGQMVETGAAPISSSRHDFIMEGILPRKVSRLSSVVAWYKLVSQTSAPDDSWLNDLPRVLRQTIIDIGGEDAITELERLRKERAFPGAEWLGHSIIEIQDRMLTDLHKRWDPGALLDFINHESMGVVRDARDLFEWACKAIEEEKESLERHGEQVGGYWTGNEPQQEPICQNILWPAVKRRLSNLGIVGVEERFVGPNRVDFWIVKPADRGQEVQVFVELKIAREGYTAKDLIDPTEQQLWQKYLQPTGQRFGIYVVLWFKDKTRYAYPTAWKTKDEFEQELLTRCTELAQEHRLSLACYVMDMTAPIRSR